MIEVKGLHKSYGGFEAVKDVSFQVAPGTVFGFIGPNGAGKTTTIRMLSTLLEPTAGTALVDGHCVVNYPERVRQIIGYMPDRFGVYEGIQVWEYLEFFAAAYKLPRGRRRAIAEEVMELTDLTPLKEKLVSELSKGMRQRLCLAKTLIHDPKVLILDEPAAGLDPRARIEFRALLVELSRMGKTVFISSHILTELSGICQEVGIIEQGQILACGSVESIARALSPSRRVRIRVLRGAAEAVEWLKKRPEVLEAAADGETVRATLQGGEEVVPEIVKYLAGLDVPIAGLEQEHHNLETLFMQITKGAVA
ncbi:MAG: ABC transporter ATP-binding protein [Planctomycetes bacterium]|nr:ABC transporter ATP-binding protein [Planctomycetota bacterium]